MVDATKSQVSLSGFRALLSVTPHRKLVVEIMDISYEQGRGNRTGLRIFYGSLISDLPLV